MSFKALLALAAQTNFTIAVSASGPNKEALSLIFVPAAKEGQDPVLANPFRLAGTVEDLDANFATEMDRILGARHTLSETADAAVAILEAATKAQAEKTQTDKPAKGKGAVKPAPVATPKQAGAPTSSDDEADDDGNGSTAAASAKEAAPVGDVQTANLFG